MQKLIFHPKWDKTVADKDREKIKQGFQDAHFSETQDIQFTTLWRAINHKEELLVTVLVHNLGDREFSPINEKFSYMKNNQLIAERNFSIPELVVMGKTSMPWTFIFPEKSFEQIDIDETGEFRRKNSR